MIAVTVPILEVAIAVTIPRLFVIVTIPIIVPVRYILVVTVTAA